MTKRWESTGQVPSGSRPAARWGSTCLSRGPGSRRWGSTCLSRGPRSRCWGSACLSRGPRSLRLGLHVSVPGPSKPPAGAPRVCPRAQGASLPSVAPRPAPPCMLLIPGICCGSSFFVLSVPFSHHWRANLVRAELFACFVCAFGAWNL